MVIDESGAISRTVDHLPFGETVSEEHSENDPGLRYPGQWTVPEAEALGLPEMFYNGFRWYRAGWGRYSQADPLGGGNLFRGLDVPESLYEYAQGNPLVFFDPLGLCTCSDQCPEWSYFGVGGGGALVGGMFLSRGNFTCTSNGSSVPVKTICLVGGLIGAAGLGIEGDLGFNRVHACNKAGLLGSGHGSMGTIGPFSVSGTADGTIGGIGRSTGLGGAYIWCKTTYREGWLLNPFGG